MKLLEILPLVVFVALIRDMDRSIVQNWETPFIVSGLVALISILGVFFQKKIFNRVLLGLNLYLLTGGIALITHQWWLNNLYGRFQGSGMLAWVILVGLVSMVASPRGFIGLDCPDAKQVKVFSLYLLLVSMGACLISFGFQGNPLLSEVIPFTGLFVIQARLKSRLTSISNQ